MGGKAGEKLKKAAEMERWHAEFLKRILRRFRVGAGEIKIGKMKLSLYVLLLRLLGLGLTLRILELNERGAVELYSKLLDSGELGENEKKGLRRLLEDELLHEQEFIEEETRFEEFLNHIREVVLGMNDGLVEVLSVTTGLIGVYGEPVYIALGGLIVGAAGALSMGIGAMAGARAQSQIHENILQRGGAAARYVGHIFRKRIKEYARRKGYSENLAEALAEESTEKPERMTDIILEEEYGLKRESLENPFKSGLYTGLSYLLGAAIPLLPYFFQLPILLSLPLSLLSASIALSFTGFIIAVSANLKIRKKIIEMLAAGLGSAGATYIIGRFASILLKIEIM